MDPLLTNAIAFLLGTVTGAAGKYMADRFTDLRREKNAAKGEDRLWRDIESRFPAVIAEMRAVFSGEHGETVRAFFVKNSGTVLAFASEPAFEYHPDEHAELRAAILHLERHGFVTDITPGKTQMYRVHEKLVDRLRGTHR